jgi:hypothetical protein
MTIHKGRGVRVEISKTEGSAKTVTAVTKASPGVATSTSHGLTDGTVGYMSGVTGMVQLDGQAARVDNSATNAFDLEALDTTNYATFTGGSFVPITAWSTISNSTSFSVGGGDGEKLDATTLLDVIKKEENGLLAAETITINVLADPQLEATGLVRACALNSGYAVFRVTLADGSQIVFRGQPSIPGFDMQKGQIATGSFSITVKGVIAYLP